MKLWTGAAALLVAAVCVAPAGGVSAQTTLVSGLGGAAGYGTNCMSPNDDGSSSAINISSAFPAGLRFFTQTHSQIFVNTNGNITFGQALPQYSPNAFPVAARPMIAPYWADVDIRTIRTPTCTALSGTCRSNTDSGRRCQQGDSTMASGSGTCLNPVDNGVWWYTEPGRIVVTWDPEGSPHRTHMSVYRRDPGIFAPAACFKGYDNHQARLPDETCPPSRA